MTLTFVGENAFPSYIALSTDIDSSASTVAGAIIVGKTLYATDTGAWYIITGSLKLETFKMPALYTTPQEPPA